MEENRRSEFLLTQVYILDSTMNNVGAVYRHYANVLPACILCVELAWSALQLSKSHLGLP